ncbi:MerR family transcriptional regulator [Sphingomonas parapaucimobilis]|uniref:MerR family transcriptional regulator n=1 Tax=Sphingomonas parapaucimobilis TaxID=28213 RepID=UPI0039EBB737
MPLPRKVLNGFTAAEVHAVSGLSRPMIEYLKRHGFLQPAYAPPDNPRGRVRFYSYRDLVVARLIQRLRETGIQLRRLKAAVERIAQDSFWSDGITPAEGLNWLVSDGRTCLLRNQDGFLDDFIGGGQRALAFVVNMGELLVEVRDRVPEEKRGHFTMATAQLKFVPKQAPRRAATGSRDA